MMHVLINLMVEFSHNVYVYQIMTLYTLSILYFYLPFSTLLNCTSVKLKNKKYNKNSERKILKKRIKQGLWAAMRA